MRADDVLAREVVGLPLEPFAEQVTAEGGKGRVVVGPAEGRRRREAAQPARLRTDDPVADPAEQEGDLGPVGAVVDVGLVEREELPVPPGWSIEEG